MKILLSTEEEKTSWQIKQKKKAGKEEVEVCQEWNLIYCDGKHRTGPISPTKGNFQQIAN